MSDTYDTYARLQTLIANATRDGVTRCHTCSSPIMTLDDADEQFGRLVHEWCIDVNALFDDVYRVDGRIVV